MRKLAGVCLLAAALMCPLAATAQDPAGYDAPFADSLETRVFPLPAMMHAARGWQDALRSDPGLQALAAERAGRVSEAACSPAPQCLAAPWTWTKADIATVSARLRLLAEDRKRGDALVGRHLRGSHRFDRHAALSDAELLVAAWQDTAAAINQVIAVYATGAAPRYPKIDAIIFDPATAEFAQVLSAHGVATAAQSRSDDVFFDPSLRYALGLLRMNERTDAGAYRPLLGGDNAATMRAIERAKWKTAPYTALLVFGHGPEDAVSRTGVMGHIRLGIAADLYKRGLAPFLIVSGGNVHPNRTPFNEAVEMKRLLISDYGIPAERILMEPHARHTTTNLRNTARLLLGAGFPTDKPALVVSDHKTIEYIAGPVLAARSVREMGVQPGTLSPGPNRFSLRFMPDPTAFHVDAAADPLDP
jgi:hypothetical protein